VFEVFREGLSGVFSFIVRKSRLTNEVALGISAVFIFSDVELRSSTLFGWRPFSYPLSKGLLVSMSATPILIMDVE